MKASRQRSAVRQAEAEKRHKAIYDKNAADERAEYVASGQADRDARAEIELKEASERPAMIKKLTADVAKLTKENEALKNKIEKLEMEASKDKK